MSRRCITSCAPKAATNNSSETITTLTYIGGGINPPMPDVINAIREALQMAFFMFWEVLWPLALGFLISAVVQSLVSREAVVRALGADDLRGVTLATVLGAASSSCSYAAVAVARGLLPEGSTFAHGTASVFGRTNSVVG